MKNESKSLDVSATKPGCTRRIAVMAMIGAGLSGKHWVRPVVDSVILPVHANTTSATELQYFADISSRLTLNNASSALLCVEVLDGSYIGKLAVTFNDGQIDLFSGPATPLGQVSTLTGVCQPGGPFLAQNPDQQGLTVAFAEDSSFSIPLAACALPAANCTPGSVQFSAQSSSVRSNGW